MSDDNFDRFIGDAAAEYNRPPARVPRDEMWARIQRERVAKRDDVTVVPLRSRRQWVGIVAAIAAALVLGVLLGRSSTTPQSPTVQTAENNPNPPQQPQGVERVAEPDTGIALIAPQKALAVASPETRRVPRRALPEEIEAQRESEVSYDLARTNHLAQMEALLTTFRAEAHGRADGQLATWARDLLMTTRLLLDSPAAEDAKNRRLLEDLELVLVQIVNLAPDAGAADRGSIERTLENGQVMTRLRSAVPAGGLPSGT